MKDNRIEIVEVVLGKDESRKMTDDQARKIFEDNGYDVITDSNGDTYVEKDEELYDYNDMSKAEQDAFDVLAIGNIDAPEISDDTKFSQYQLEGEKENYKEVLVTLPRKSNLDDISDKLFSKKYTELNASERVSVKREARSQGQVVDESNTFRSSHFDEPNILVHLRMNTRTDVEGNKILFLEEVQSDWGQKGKREGFNEPLKIEIIEVKNNRIVSKDGKVLLNTFSDSEIQDWQIERASKESGIPKQDLKTDKSISYKATVDGKKVAGNHLTKEDARKNAIEDASKIGKSTIPSAPFVTDTNAWTKLGLKTALKEAVAQGADKLAWTTGEQQNDRYDLSKSVDQISIAKQPNGNDYVVVGVKDNNIIVNRIAKESELEGIVGKEIASKAINEGQNVFKGKDLAVGGKGMKGFYGSPSEGSLGIVGNVAKSLFGQEPKTLEISKGSDNLTNKEALSLLEQGEKIYTYNRGTMYRLYDIHDINEATNYFSKKGEAKSTQYSIDITPELKQAVKSGLPLFKNNIVQATERRKEAKAKLDALNRNLGIAQDPKEKAKALFNYHKALVEEALAYIEAGAQDIKNKINSAKEFAEKIGLELSDAINDAWNEANGGKKKVESDFEETIDVLEEEELNVMGITKKEARRQREELGEEQYQYEVKSRAVLEEEATRLLEEGFSVPRLIKRINKDPKAADVEIELLRRHFTSLTARINKKPTPELLQERKDLMSALDLLKTSAGRTVQAFDGLIAIEDNLASYLEEESKYADLSENEIEELTEKYNKAKEALDKYEELERKAAEEALNKKLQSEINKTKKTRAEIKGDFKQKRQQYVTDARAELKKIRNSYSAVIVPYQRELIALAPFAKKMAQSYAEEGIYELKEIVKGIKDEFINDIPELTDIDIKMMLSGQYPNTRKTKNAKLAEMRDLEIQAKLEIKIEELEKGIIQTPNPVKKRVKSEKVEALEKEIALIKKRNPDLTYPSKIQARKTFYKNRIEELKKEIKSGEFDVIEAPIPIVLDDETLKLKDEFIKFKEETRIRREKKEHEALSEFEKNLAILRELTEIKRIVQTSIDVSIPMRQGVSVMFNPRTTKLGVEAYGKMLNTMFSEKKYNRLMYDIEKNPEFLRSKDDGIVYTDLGSNNIELRDESHPIKGFIQRIPILGKGIKISARAAAAWTNYARFELYQRQVRFLKAQGKTRENAKEAYEQAAARVMTDTGRGKLPILSDKIPSKEGTAFKEALGTVFYGARLYSSTFRKLNLLYYLNPKVDKTVRIEALKDMAGYVASQIIVTTAVAALLGASVSLDYDEPDFMKIRIGKRVIDLTAGQGVYIRTFLRLVHAAYNRFDPTVSEKDANKYAQFAIQSVGTFWRNKLAPNTSYLYSALSGKNSIGEKFDPYEIIKIYPMYTDDIITAFKEGSPLDALFILPVGLSGIGYQEYSKDIRRARVNNYVKDKDLLLFLKSKKLNIQGDINQEVYDLETNEQVKMTKEQSDKYEKVWSETIINRIKAEKKDLDKLSEEELGKEITKFKSDATRTAKEVVTGVDPYIITIEDKDKTYELTPTQIKERKVLNKEYIDEFGDDIIEAQTDIAIEEGKSPQEAKIIAEKKLKSLANANSKLELLEKYTDDNENITLKIKE
jgi:hypothetical protein